MKDRYGYLPEGKDEELTSDLAEAKAQAEKLPELKAAYDALSNAGSAISTYISINGGNARGASDRVNEFDKKLESFNELAAKAERKQALRAEIDALKGPANAQATTPTNDQNAQKKAALARQIELQKKINELKGAAPETPASKTAPESSDINFEEELASLKQLRQEVTPKSNAAPAPARVSEADRLRAEIAGLKLSNEKAALRNEIKQLRSQNEALEKSKGVSPSQAQSRDNSNNSNNSNASRGQIGKNEGGTGSSNSGQSNLAKQKDDLRAQIAAKKEAKAGQVHTNTLKNG